MRMFQCVDIIDMSTDGKEVVYHGHENQPNTTGFARGTHYSG